MGPLPPELLLSPGVQITKLSLNKNKNFYFLTTYSEPQLGQMFFNGIMPLNPMVPKLICP